jgi:hypothetical protein
MAGESAGVEVAEEGIGGAQVPHEGSAERHPSGEGKITHVMIRLYGALVGLQAWFVWNLRKTDDPQLRRNAIAGYAVLFAVSALTLARAQLTEGGGMSPWNWANISVFSALAAAYAYFAVFLPRSSFESLGRMNS